MKKIYQTTHAPKPVGPYNQAVSANGMLYVSGQIAIHPKTQQLVTENISVETTQVMKNIQAILSEAGATFARVVKSSIFLKNMDDFDQVNNVYGTFFNEATAPARECVAVAKLPKNVSVEISVIAYL